MILKFVNELKTSAADEELFLPGNKFTPSRLSRRWMFVIFFQWIIIATLCAATAHEFIQLRRRIPQNGEEIYSPVNHLLSYKNVVFTGGFGTGRTKYQGPPTPERNALWDDPYNFGVSRIPRSSASQLLNKTVPIPNDEGYYVVSLNVFHQLYCVNMIRKRIWSTETYEPDDELMGIEHLEHCIDALRQSLMCSADVTPIPWKWWEEDHEAKAVAEMAHTCRNFEDIRVWAKENQVKDFDRTIYVEDSAWRLFS